MSQRRRASAAKLSPNGSLATLAWDPAGDPAEAVAERARFVAALNRISEKDREALLLVAWDGLEPSRAAVALGISTSAFAVRLHRARRRFLKSLDEVVDTDVTEGSR